MAPNKKYWWGIGAAPFADRRVYLSVCRYVVSPRSQSPPLSTSWFPPPAATSPDRSRWRWPGRRVPAGGRGRSRRGWLGRGRGGGSVCFPVRRRDFRRRGRPTSRACGRRATSRSPIVSDNGSVRFRRRGRGRRRGGGFGRRLSPRQRRARTTIGRWRRPWRGRSRRGARGLPGRRARSRHRASADRPRRRARGRRRCRGRPRPPRGRGPSSSSSAFQS
mmetsp:Transcript_30779/g.99219  ORF Transcript_30779/g.99219 Transcript_30779/m.99219 type:complete len:219 (+) Transcript_30779:79-735(+)